MMVGGEKPSLDELAHFGVKGMKWGVRTNSRLRPSNWMAVKEGTPKAERIGRESEARRKVTEAKTVSGHEKALANLATVQRSNRAETKKPATSTHPSYTRQMQSNDREQHGKRAVKRINDRLNEGETRDEALRREQVRNGRQALAVAGGLLAARVLAAHGSTSASDLKSFVGNKANDNRNAARVANQTLKIGAKAAGVPYIKPRGGVHNITTMK